MSKKSRAKALGWEELGVFASSREMKLRMNKAMNQKVRPTPHPQVASRIVDGEALIVLADSGEVVVLNSTGSRIWELADGSRTLDEIAKVIVSEYNTTQEQAEKDVAAFVQELVDNKMFVLEDERPASQRG